VKRLAGWGHEVRVLDDFSRGSRIRLSGVPATVIHGSVLAPADVTEAIWGCDMVIHLAYVNGTATFYADPRKVLDVALNGMLNVLGGCEASGCQQMLLASSSEVYQSAPVPTREDVPLTVPSPLNPRYSYGGGKIACELLASAWQRSGVLDRVVIARPHNIIGPDMGREHVIPEFTLRMNHLVLTHPEGVIPFPVQGSGEETRSFCYIDDAVDQLMVLLGHGDVAREEGVSIANVGVMDERSIADAAREVAKCYGREIKIMPGVLPEGSPPRRLPDTAKIRALGAPGTHLSFGEAIRRTVNWYRERGDG
jgi:dTDP-glucose 4,6-dehydratase/UDP-glucose 4-epimerase